MRFIYARGPDGEDIPLAVDAEGNIKTVLVNENGPITENGALKVNNGDIDKDIDNITTYEALQDGGSSSRLSVTNAGTRQAVAAVTTPCVGVSFQAYETNTNRVTIGFSDVVGASATRKGIRSLESGDYHYQPITDASKLYIDSVVNNEGCIVTIHTRSY